MLGAGLTLDGDRVMRGAKDTKFGKKSRFGNLVFRYKKNKEAGRSKRRGVGRAKQP